MLFDNKKIGRFSLPISIVEQNPITIKKLFSEMIIVEALIRPSSEIEYTAICDKFEERTEGYGIPMYSIDFIKEDGKKINYDIRRVL